MKLKFTNLPVLFAVLLLASACRKKKNPEPVVTISLPSSGTTYSPGDTVQIEADLSDDEPLSSVTVKLLNAAYIPVDHQESVAINATSFHLVYSYVIENEYLETGDYYITLSVTDGDNNSNAYRSIVIHEIPRTVRAVYFLTQPDTSEVSVYRLDSAGVPEYRFGFAGDYSGSAMDSRYDRLHVVGSVTGAYRQFEPESGTEQFSLPPYNSLLPSYQSLFLSGHLAFISYFDGRIRAFDYNGNVKFNSQQPVYYQPGALCANDAYVFAEAWYPSAMENRLVVINYPSGIPRQEFNLGADIVSMVSSGNDRVILFCNLNADGKIYSYTISSNAASDLHSLFSNRIYSAISTDSDRFALATANGLYSYQFSGNNLVPVDVSGPVYALEYDDVNGILYTASGKNIRTYAFPNSGVLNTIVSQDSVLDVRLLFSK